jgi:iduronate 2-sulfatase
VPLLVSVPWLPRAHGRRTAALVELVDVFPTLSALAGLPDPTIHPGDAPLDGISLLPLFSAGTGTGTGTGTETNESGKRKGRPFAISQYPRCPVNQTDPALLWQDNWCIEVSSSNFSWMGYSIRNDSWRYTAWFSWDGDALLPRIPSDPVNGSHGFYDELFASANASAVSSSSSGMDFDESDVVEVRAVYPGVARALFDVLVAAIQGSGTDVRRIATDLK